MSKIQWTKAMESYWLSDIFKEAAKLASHGTHLFMVGQRQSTKIVSHNLASWHLGHCGRAHSTQYVTIGLGEYSDYRVYDFGSLCRSLEQFYCLWYKQLSVEGRFIVVSEDGVGRYRFRIGEEYNEQC